MFKRLKTIFIGVRIKRRMKHLIKNMNGVAEEMLSLCHAIENMTDRMSQLAKELKVFEDDKEQQAD